MKKIFLIAILTLTVGNTYAQTWYTNYEKAVKKAKAENKTVLLNFTGSDWCGYCHKLDKSVFSKKDFKSFAEKNLILVKVDFPRRSELSAEEKKQNDLLAMKHNIRSFPTIILLNKNEKPLYATGFQRTSAAKYVSDLQKHIK